KRIILPQAYANPFYRIGNSKKNPFHSHAGKPVFDFGYFWLFRVIYESSFPQKRESVFLWWIKFKPVQPCLSLPYYLYCLRLRRLVLIFVNPL
ncbi:hypothetical protein, partial [Neisseria gonorrhoeae]|uniref:hypothetical protein n=1 Tax=Neisseria gonorrhoeae TaxID=485 RepID=UPI0015D672C4